MGSEAIHSLVCGYARRHWGTKLLVILKAFVDDSTSQVGARNSFLAAYVHTAETWAAFSDEWDAELRRDPAIGYLKMSEAASRVGEFKGFSIKARDRKVFALARIIKKHSPWGFHTSVSTVDFAKILKPLAPHPMRTPLFPLCYAIMFGVARIHHRFGVDVPCDFIFDHYDGLAAKVVPLFDVVMSSQDSAWIRLIGGAPSFRDDKLIVPLQAADMLAWWIRRRDDGVESRNFEGLDDLLIVEGVHHYTEIDAATLERLASGLRGIPGSGEFANKRNWEAILPYVVENNRRRFD